MTDVTTFVAQLLFLAADNVAAWQPYAIVVLALIVVTSVTFAIGLWEGLE